MNIQNIKTQISQEQGISLPHLVLVRQFDQTTNESQPWVSHWEDTKRVRISMHQDVLAKLKAEPEYAGLALKSEVVPATESRAAYTRYIVITPLNIEATF